MDQPAKRKWTLPVLGVGFGAAFLLTLCTGEGDHPEKKAAPPRSVSQEETGLIRHTEAPTKGWGIAHSNWWTGEDESRREPEPFLTPSRGETWQGMDIGVVVK